MMAVSLQLGADPVFAKPVVLFDEAYDYARGLSIANYDVTPDGRFIMVRPEPHANRASWRASAGAKWRRSRSTFRPTSRRCFAISLRMSNGR